jgi:alkylhydroperoxidase/carboxymuconolactone decarboxylase family protein YurZ
MQGFGQLAKAAMAPGALDEKHKELIALAIGNDLARALRLYGLA